MYKRVMLKLSGEMLQGDKDSGISFDVAAKFARALVEIQKSGVQVAVVIGGGNFWRYRDFKDEALDRVTSDHTGMIATIMNALVMSNVIEQHGGEVRTCSALPILGVAPSYVQKKALKHLEKGRIVLLPGGTGSPFFTTDSAAALRALELNCDVLLKATKVDGVYDSDPFENTDAKKFDKLSYEEVIEKKLEVMDITAVSLLQKSGMPIVVFNIDPVENLRKVLSGEKIGTIIQKVENRK